MPVIELQRLPGAPKERISVPAGTVLAGWLLSADIHADVVVVVNGRELGLDDEVGFALENGDRVQVFDQPKGVIGQVLNPVFKVISKIFSFLAPKSSFSVADNNSKESPNNKLTGQTNVARTYQARPDVYGQVRSYPDLIQESMFEFIDNVKYVTEWMNFGIGRYTVDSVRYSESNLGSLAGASYQVFEPGQVIPVIYEGFEFDDVDGQELPGPNESEDFPAYTATVTTVISGELAGGEIAMKILKQDEFDYFYSLAFPHAVTFVINVTYNTASGSVTRDVTLNANLFNATLTDDGELVDPERYYTFYFDELSGGDAQEIPTDATINTTKFVLNDNQPLVIGPFFAPLEGDQLWVHFQAQLGNDNWANYTGTYWKIDDDNNLIPGTTGTFSGGLSNSSGGSDTLYRTDKIVPAAGYGRYAVQIVRTNNSNDTSVLQLSEIHSVRIRTNEVHPDDTLVRVTIRATEQATGVRERKYNALITRHTISYNMATRQVNYTLRPSRSFADALAHEWLVIGKESPGTIDLYGLYEIAASLPDQRLGYFDYTFDDEDISLGSRAQSICDAARVIAFWEDGVLSFVRDERVLYPATTFNRSNMTSDEYKITYEMTMPGGYDGVEIEYVSPVTNKKTYIRYRITATGITEQAADSPLKIKLLGCRNEYQARDRALLEVNRLVYSRGKMTCTTLADGQYVSVGDVVQVPDTYDVNQQSGYIVKRTGNNFDTSEAIDFAGAMFVTVTDSLGRTSARYPATVRADTRFGFTAALPAIALNIWDGYEVQSPSRYVIATQEEMDATLWRVDEKKPNSDGTTAFTLSEYSDLIYP
ncbi:host specificity factor TipJ family phage tail protein [Pantoea coffeiphila]|uniref:Phage tail protein n=1 Tax=Pantoea coffeiphila TaxID=1465635 RepID=A0A2S9I5K4_9GAMM|nr:host specificity factor TipJ family phage tail protein [Pantoea coffeiphila]PRD13083.1 phage tail protein [Pantoea coffeiphila]